uniref:PIN domain-containing protein n=1 Tax=Candidatus Electronema sp. TaxID=2698783 RepID=UPI00405691BE
MNIYAETNFVLELVFRQEQSRSCEQIVALSNEGRIKLILPAYSLVEPYETLIRRHRERRRLKTLLDAELNQLARTDSYAADILHIHPLSHILVRSTEEEADRLEKAHSDLLQIAELIPLTADILRSSAQYQHKHDLSPQDAVVCASVLHHLRQNKPAAACFLNKNSKDFDDPDITELFERHNCAMLFRFDHGCQFIINQLHV